jgi:hypothetical protein
MQARPHTPRSGTRSRHRRSFLNAGLSARSLRQRPQPLRAEAALPAPQAAPQGGGLPWRPALAAIQAQASQQLLHCCRCCRPRQPQSSPLLPHHLPLRQRRRMREQPGRTAVLLPQAHHAWSAPPRWRQGAHASLASTTQAQATVAAEPTALELRQSGTEAADDAPPSAHPMAAEGRGAKALKLLRGSGDTGMVIVTARNHIRPVTAAPIEATARGGTAKAAAGLAEAA